MTTYKGRWEAIRGPLAVLAVMLAIVLTIFFFIPRGFFSYFFIVLILFFVPLTYSGIILRIVVDDKKLVIFRLLTITVIRFEDVALTAVHCIEEGKYLIYAFVKARGFKGYTVKGIKPRLPFDEVVKLASKDEDINLDMNFSRAKKIPLSFVENAEELKDRFLFEVGKHHVRIMDDIN